MTVYRHQQKRPQMQLHFWILLKRLLPNIQKVVWLKAIRLFYLKELMLLIELEPISCAVDPKLSRAIQRFSEQQPAISDLDGIIDQLWYEGDTFYKVMPDGF